jgi:hypothetical protein
MVWPPHLPDGDATLSQSVQGDEWGAYITLLHSAPRSGLPRDNTERADNPSWTGSPSRSLPRPPMRGRRRSAISTQNASLTLRRHPTHTAVETAGQHRLRPTLPGQSSSPRAPTPGRRGRAREGCCPNCGCPSARVHDHYHRQLQDVALAGRPVQIVLEVRRAASKKLTAATSRDSARFGLVASGADPWGQGVMRTLRHLRSAMSW